MRSILNAFVLNYADFIHPCPYVGRHKMMNIKFQDKNALILPAGFYREVVKITDDDSKTFLYVNMLLEVTNI